MKQTHFIQPYCYKYEWENLQNSLNHKSIPINFVVSTTIKKNQADNKLQQQT